MYVSQLALFFPFCKYLRMAVTQLTRKPCNYHHGAVISKTTWELGREHGGGGGEDSAKFQKGQVHCIPRPFCQTSMLRQFL